VKPALPPTSKQFVVRSCNGSDPVDNGLASRRGVAGRQRGGFLSAMGIFQRQSRDRPTVRPSSAKSVSNLECLVSNPTLPQWR